MENTGNKLSPLSAIGIAVLAFAGMCLLGIILFFGVLFVFFGTMGEEAVTQIIPSPDGRYRVEIIRYDDGALGGSTKVRVVETGKQGKLSEVGQKPVGRGESVTQGAWDDDTRLTVVWVDDNHFQLIRTYASEGTRDIMEVSYGEKGIKAGKWKRLNCYVIKSGLY